MISQRWNILLEMSVYKYGDFGSDFKPASRSNIEILKLDETAWRQLKTVQASRKARIRKKKLITLLLLNLAAQWLTVPASGWYLAVQDTPSACRKISKRSVKRVSGSCGFLCQERLCPRWHAYQIRPSRCRYINVRMDPQSRASLLVKSRRNNLALPVEIAYRLKESGSHLEGCNSNHEAVSLKSLPKSGVVLNPYSIIQGAPYLNRTGPPLPRAHIG